MPARRHSLVPAALLAALVLAGCSDREPARQPSAPSDSAARAAGAPAPGAARSPAAPPGAGAPAYSGDLRRDREVEALEAFLQRYRASPAVELHLRLSDDQARDLRSMGGDRLWLNLTRLDGDGILTGSELNILSPDSTGANGKPLLAVSVAPGAARLDGRIAVEEVLGPQMGIFSIVARPAS